MFSLTTESSLFSKDTRLKEPQLMYKTEGVTSKGNDNTKKCIKYKVMKKCDVEKSKF